MCCKYDHRHIKFQKPLLGQLPFYVQVKNSNVCFLFLYLQLSLFYSSF
jgi:hypothetical protein